ncbi:MAG: S41 family peptidase, partial [Actinocrinis sp.]
AADEGSAAVELAVGDLGHITELAASPAGAQIAFATNRQQLWTVDVDAAEPAPRLIDSSAHERIEDLAWSPDGRWLAYTHPNSPRTSAIKVADAATGRVCQITRPVLRDSSPVFDPRGRYLYFLSQRDLTPEADRVQFEIGFPFGARPYLAVLRAGEPAPFRGPNPPPGAEPQSGGLDEPPDVRIDFDGLDRRVVPLPVAEGRYAGLAALPRSVLLLTVPVLAPDPKRPGAEPEGTVASVDLATGEVTADYLEPVDELSASRDSEVLLYRWNDRLRVLSANVDQDTAAEFLFRGAPATRQSGWIDLGRIMVPLDPAAEWRQMFREAWRLQRESFWNADMAGVDWDGIYERYLPLAGAVSCRSELSDLLWELQGELATSHAYERDGDYRRPDEHAQGFLGVDWDVAWPTGGGLPRWRVGRILRGDPWNGEATSPCLRPGADVREGDTVVAINGQPIGADGPGELLVGQAGRDVELTLHRDGAAPRRAVVRALGSEAGTRYRDWAERRREQVHETSRGRLGYIHVPDMFATGYAEFVRGFLAELDREGLVVDVRFNGGGHVSPLLLDRLARRRAGTEHGRWSGAAPYPVEAPRGPMAVLINEHTGSDGEIFSHLFRARGFGPLIGERTWGGVIATWPRHRLVDGTLTTQPEFRYFFRGVGDGLENRGVEPDIEVEAGPGDSLASGTRGDIQLATAVRHLLGVLDERPPAEAIAGQCALDLVAARGGRRGG